MIENATILEKSLGGQDGLLFTLDEKFKSLVDSIQMTMD